MIISIGALGAPCSCGNKDPKQFKEYDGSLGDAAIVCKKCGEYRNIEGIHLPDKWSMQFVETKKKKEKKYLCDLCGKILSGNKMLNDFTCLSCDHLSLEDHDHMKQEEIENQRGPEE